MNTERRTLLNRYGHYLDPICVVYQAVDKHNQQLVDRVYPNIVNGQPLLRCNMT